MLGQRGHKKKKAGDRALCHNWNEQTLFVNCLLRERPFSTTGTISTELGLVRLHTCGSSQVQWKQPNMLLMLKTYHVLYNNPAGNYHHPQRHSRKKKKKKKQFILVFPGMWRGRTGHTHCVKWAHKLQTCSNRDAGHSLATNNTTEVAFRHHRGRIFRCWMSLK